MITLKDLKKAVPEFKSKDRKKNLPTAKSLRESGIGVVVREKLGDDCEVAVYRNGLVLYRRERYSTVFRLHKCKDYYYSEALAGEFDTVPYHFLLMLEGEQRLEHNEDVREAGWYDTVYGRREKERLKAGEEFENPLERLLRQERMDMMGELLSERQFRVLSLFYVEELNQTVIAEMMHISRSTVAVTLRNALAKLRENGEELR